MVLLMGKILFFSISLLLLICGCAVPQKKSDLLATPGMETPSDQFSGSAFLPYSKMITAVKSGWPVKNPQEQSAAFTVLNGIL